VPPPVVEVLPEPVVEVVEVVEPPKHLCNCYLFVKESLPNLPPTKQILSNLTTSGEVIVFYYAAVGLYHYALVKEVHQNHYVIEETNYRRCQYGKREVSKSDPSIIGFFSPGK
jgi:hypothetical protein